MFDPTPFQPLIESAPKRRYRKGTLLIQEGDTSKTLYGVVSGSVRSFSSSLEEKEITFGVYGPGMLVGEMSLDGHPRSTSVETLEGTECAVIEPELLIKHLTANPDLTMALVKLVIYRARLATEAARNMALMDVYGRVKHFLENAPATVDGSVRVLKDKVTQRDIAARIGSSREMVSRVFKELESGGYLSANGGQITMNKKLPNSW